jgi:hypothetical protein
MALRPPEPFRARAPGRDDVAGRERRAFGWVLFRFVTDAQFDRVHAERDRQLVHRAFQTKTADRFSRRAHEGVGEHVQIRYLDFELEAARRIVAACRLDERLG